MNINDWSAIQTLFDKLNKQVEKAQKTTNTLGSPRIYIRMLVELEVKVLDNHMSALHHTLPGVFRSSAILLECGLTLACWLQEFLTKTHANKVTGMTGYSLS